MAIAIFPVSSFLFNCYKNVVEHMRPDERGLWAGCVRAPMRHWGTPGIRVGQKDPAIKEPHE